VETIIHSESGFASVAFLRINKAHLEKKKVKADPFAVAIPPLLRPPFLELQQSVSSITVEERPTGILPVEISKVERQIVDRILGNWLAVTEITAKLPPQSAEICIEDELRLCFTALEGKKYLCENTSIVKWPRTIVSPQSHPAAYRKYQYLSSRYG
jgi:diphthine-ammonia ligase